MVDALRLLGTPGPWDWEALSYYHHSLILDTVQSPWGRHPYKKKHFLSGIATIIIIIEIVFSHTRKTSLLMSEKRGSSCLNSKLKMLCSLYHQSINGYHGIWMTSMLVVSMVAKDICWKMASWVFPIRAHPLHQSQYNSNDSQATLSNSFLVHFNTR